MTQIKACTRSKIKVGLPESALNMESAIKLASIEIVSSQSIHPSNSKVRFDFILLIHFESAGPETGHVIHILMMGCCLTVKSHGQLSTS